MISLALTFLFIKGWDKGEPLSPLLFNIVADGLACLVKKAHDEGLIMGLISHIIDKLLLTFSMSMILSSFCMMI